MGASWPGIELVSPSLQGSFLTTGPSGKPRPLAFLLGVWTLVFPYLDLICVGLLTSSSLSSVSSPQSFSTWLPETSFQRKTIVITIAYVYLAAYCIPGTMPSASYVPTHLIPSTIVSDYPLLQVRKQRFSNLSEATELVSLSLESILLTSCDETITETV